MSAPSLQAARKLRTREAIIASAASLARERGLEAPSVADVMARAGLTVGGFYAHFESKEALFEEVIRATARRTWDGLLQGGETRPAAARARQAVNRYLSTGHRDDATSGCLLPAATADVARLGGRHRAALRDELLRSAAAVEGLLGGGPAARRRALALIALLYGGLSLARALRGTALSGQFLEAARVLALAGVKASGPANRGRRARRGR